MGMGEAGLDMEMNRRLLLIAWGGGGKMLAYSQVRLQVTDDNNDLEWAGKLSQTMPVLTLTLALQVACYSCTSRQWSTVCPLPAGHGEPGIAVLDNRIYVLGGRSHNRGSRTGYVHIYDMDKDCWEEGPQLNNSISGLAACVLTLPRSLLCEPPRGTPNRSQADADFASEVMSVSDWEEFDNSSED